MAPRKPSLAPFPLEADGEKLLALPGGDLLLKGLDDLQTNLSTEEALLVLVAAPRLRGLGFDIPVDEDATEPAEHRLYAALEDRCGKGAHAAYNALIRRIVSFANAYSVLAKKAG